MHNLRHTRLMDQGEHYSTWTDRQVRGDPGVACPLGAVAQRSGLPSTVALVSIHFDAASGTALHPIAREVLIAALDAGWADPARLYRSGRTASLLLEQSRADVAEVLGARTEEVHFTTSGTQADHLAVLGGLAGRRRAGTVLVHSAVEHSAVLAAADRHAVGGGTVHAVGVDRLGRVDVDDYRRILDAGGVGLCSLMSANHEVGTRQPLAEVAAACSAVGVPLHVDAAQSLGREPIEPGWSLLTGSAHKWGGPLGVGILVVRAGTRFRSVLPDDEREHGLVPGRPDVPAIAAAAAALKARAEQSADNAARIRPWIDRLRGVAAAIPGVEVVGDPDDRLPHILTFSCLYLDGEALVHALDRRGFAVSSGSSCTASTRTPSHVLEAMGVLSHGNVRISLDADITEADVDRFAAALPEVVAELRATAGVTDLLES